MKILWGYIVFFVRLSIKLMHREESQTHLLSGQYVNGQGVWCFKSENIEIMSCNLFFLGEICFKIKLMQLIFEKGHLNCVKKVVLSVWCMNLIFKWKAYACIDIRKYPAYTDSQVSSIEISSLQIKSTPWIHSNFDAIGYV